MSPEDSDAALLRDAKPEQDDPTAAVMRANLRARVLETDVAPVEISRFTILGTIGSGAMGTVYAAYDDILDRKIALKVLRAGADEAPAAALREARALAKLSHPGVVSVFEVARDDEPPYIAMEFVDGVDLATWLESDPAIGQVVRRMIEAGTGLAAAHDAGVVHGDFKPHNVLVGTGGARVVDFGLARLVHAGDDASRPVGGTVLYMARECLEGATPSAKSDQYAFAATMFEALFGRPPFSAKTIAALLDAMEQPPDFRGRSIPRRLHRVLARALSPDPDARYPSMDALLAELDTHDPARRSRAWALAATTLAVGSIAVVQGRFADDDPCGAGQTRGAEVWNDTRADAIAQAFSSTGAPFAASAHDTVARALTAHVEAWTQTHRETCEATRVEGRQSDTLFDARMRCLDRRLSEVDALVGALEATSSPDEVGDAVTATADLRPLSTCDASDALLAAHLEPDDPGEAKEAAAIRTTLDAGWAAFGLGRYDLARREAEGARRRADALAFAPLSPEVDLLRATVEARTGDQEAAEAVLQDARLRAAEVRNDRLAAEISVALLRTVMFSAHPERVRDLAPFARADQLRAGAEVAAIDAIEGEAALAQGDAAAAIAILDAAPTDRLPPRVRAIATTTLASAHLERNDVDRAVALYEDALVLVVATLGPDHPAVAFQRVRWGRGLRAAGRLAEAEPVLVDAKDRIEAIHGLDDRATASAYLEVGRLRAAQGRAVEARTWLERALAIRRATYGDRHARVADVERALAEL